MTRHPPVTTGPQRDECDYILGVYMGVWGTVETSMMQLLHKLLDTDITTAQIVMLSVGEMRRQRELAVELGKHRLVPEDAKRLDLLMNRLEKAAVRRNRIVHGLWFYFITNDAKLGRVTKWVRVYRPPQQDDMKELMKGKNDKLNGAYKFPPEQLKRDMETAHILQMNIGEFTIAVKLKPARIPLPVEELTPLLQG